MHEDKRESYAHTRGMHTVQNTNMWCIGNSGCRRRRRQFSFLIIMLKLIFFLLTPLYVHWEAVSFVSSTSYSQQYQKQLIMMIYSWCALILCYIDAKSSCTGNSWFYFNRKELQLFRILRVVASKWWSSRPPSGCNHSEWPHQKKSSQLETPFVLLIEGRHSFGVFDFLLMYIGSWRRIYRYKMWKLLGQGTFFRGWFFQRKVSSFRFY